MKTIITIFLALTVSLNFISCSNDNDIIYFETVIIDPPEVNLPVEQSPVHNGLGLKGFPKSIQKYQNGNLYYQAQYYYRSDGKLTKVSYSHPESGSAIYTDTYYYNTEGKLIQLDGHDVYNFYWDKNRIVEADKYNAMWHGRSKIFYTYNPEGQLIQKKEDFLDFSPPSNERTIYSYFNDGNLKRIEQYGDYTESGVIELYFVTNFEGYIEARNLFLELEIIPGEIAQHQFPSSMNVKHLTATDYDIDEIYTYKYDTEGRVIEKISDSNNVVYQYY